MKNIELNSNSFSERPRAFINGRQKVEGLESGSILSINAGELLQFQKQVPTGKKWDIIFSITIIEEDSV